MSSETQALELFGTEVSYSVRKSSQATQPRIDVDIHGVRVTMPCESSTDPRQLIEENAAWVLEKRSKYELYRNQAPNRQFESGEEFPFLGNPHEIAVEQRVSSTVAGGSLRLARSHVDRSSLKDALRYLYREEARGYFTDIADEYADRMGVSYQQIEIRNQRTRWGSCSTTGTLGLNWRLMMAPPEAIRYVVVHELAHLVEPNHSSAFWSLVAEYDPDYAHWSDWLDQNSTQLIFTTDDL